MWVGVEWWGLWWSWDTVGFLFVLGVGSTFGGAQGLLLTVYLGITPGGVEGL